MTMHDVGLKPFDTPVFTRAERFALDTVFDRPTLVLDVARVAENYLALKEGLGEAHIHYAVKANPAREVIAKLAELGGRFDAASRGEIELCLAEGVAPAHISFGNTVKRASDIAYAYAMGVTLFAADADAELEKLAEHAPGCQVYIRLIVERSMADWPLSRKFGCRPSMALRLLDRAVELGLKPVGVSFHVGSQTRRSEMWALPLDDIAEVWNAARAAGHDLTLLNIGGGFPSFYGDVIEPTVMYCASVVRQVRARFGDVTVMAEPGRGMVADAGVIAQFAPLGWSGSIDGCCVDLASFSQEILDREILSFDC